MDNDTFRRIYKNIPNIMWFHNYSIDSEILDDKSLVEELHYNNHVHVEFTNIDKNKKTHVLMLINDSKYEKGKDASKMLESLIKRIPKYKNNIPMNIILLSYEMFDSNRKKKLRSLSTDNVKIFNLQYYQIMVNPFAHIYSSEYRIVSDPEEVEYILDSLKTELRYLPKIVSSDIMTLYLDIDRGTLLEVKRIESCGEVLSYRYYE